MRRKRKSFLVSLLLILVLVFSGCQTAAVQEDQTASVSQGQEETIDSSSAGTSRETQKEEEYIDEAYVDANYGGGEEEDLSKYEETSDTGQAGSGVCTAVAGIEETDDLLPSGIGAGTADRGVAGVGAAVGEKNFGGKSTGIHRCQSFGIFHHGLIHGIAGAVLDALFHLTLYSLHK